MTAIPINPSQKDQPLKHPWSKCITVGRAYELLRADLQEHLMRLKKEFGYTQIRFHASFHDDVAVVHKLPTGEIVYRWTQLDHIYDFLVEAGFDPIVEINPMPTALASGDKTFFWYKMNITPPESYVEWERFINAYIEHTVERYGIERVRRWYFEVWNEPNLRGNFWAGTQDEYFQLYESCARVLKGFDQQLRVGGPAGAGSGWNLDFAKYCRDHNVPVDFVSYHMYPVGESKGTHPVGLEMVDHATRAKRELAENGFEHLEILVTEWNCQTETAEKKPKWVGNESVNRLIGGAVVCHYCHACDDLADSFGWWVVSDVFEEGGPQVEPYSTRFQHYGMLTIDGVPKSSYHAFSFLHRLRGERYRIALPENTPPTKGVVATDELSATRALAWNLVFPFETGEDWEIELPLPIARVHADREAIRVSIAQVREGQGSAFEYWESMGAPANLTRIEQEVLEAKARPTFTSRMVQIKDGRATVSLKLRPNEFAFIELSGDEPGRTIQHSAEQAALDEALMVD